MPGAADNAYITNNGTYTVTVNANASPGTVTIGGTSGTQTLNLSAGTFTLNGSGSGNAQSALSISGGTLAGSGDLTINGALSWTGGTMSGAGKTVIASTGSLSLSGADYLFLNRLLQNDGTATWTAANLLLNRGTFTNNGSFTANSSGTLNCRGEGGVNAFNNAGTFTKQGTGLTTVYRNNTDVSFNNSGTVEARGGVLQFSQTYVQPAGLTLVLGGKLQVDQGFTMLGGTLAGTNTLTGSVTNTGGTLSAGTSPGKLTITGNYVQGSGGAMTVELGGTAPGTGFDQVAVGGSALLAGTLNASLYGSFYPAANATFTYITAASRSGAFSSFNYPSNVVGFTNELAATTATIRVINTLSVITPVGDRTNDEMVVFNVTAIANDYDTPAQTLTWFLAAGPPGLGISSGGAISWTPAENQGPSTNTVKICAKDNGTPNLTATNTFQLVINEINVAPSLILPPDTTINEMTPLSVSASATDPDVPTNTLSFDLVSGPSGLTVSPEGAVAWMLGEADGPAVYPVTVRVTDYNPDAVNEQHLSTTGTFNVTVREVNRPPVLTVPADQRLFEETPLAVSVSATDPDIPANALTFSLLSPPEGMTIDATSGAITWTPTEAQGSNTYTITAVVTDDNPTAVNERHLSATNSFTVVVDETNSAPVLAPLADQTLHAGITFTRTATATDRDIPTNILSFSLLSAPADMTITPDGGVITWPTSDAQANSTNPVVVQVADDGAPRLVATQSFTVSAVPRPALADIHFVTVETLVTNLAQTPPVASEFTTYPEVSWSAIAGARYAFHDTAAMGDACDWHTNLFLDLPWMTATDTNASAWGPFVRRRIPAWGIDIQDPSASRCFRVQALP